MLLLAFLFAHLIVGLSGGVGYLTVFLPGIVGSQQAKLESTFGQEDSGDMRNKFNKLSAEQKAMIMHQMGATNERGEDER